FAWIETEILQQEHIAVGEAPREPLRLGADDRLGESHRLSQVALEPFPHRGETLLWIPLPFRPAEMGRDDEPGALFDQIAERRKRRHDSGVVPNRAVLGVRNVEDHADENGSARDVEVAQRTERHRAYHSRASRSRVSTRPY